MQPRGIAACCALAAVAVIFVTGCGSAKSAKPALSSGGPLAGKSVPIKAVPIKAGSAAGSPALLVNVSVAGGTKVPMVLDTGSIGLRVFASAVGTTGVEPAAETVTESLPDGTVLTGYVANAPVTIGSLASQGSIGIQIIDQASCAPELPACPAAGGLAAAATAMGAQGILGVGLGAGRVYSPLLQLEGGVPSTYSIHFSGGAGKLSFGGSPANPAAVVVLPSADVADHPNGAHAWNDREAPVCWSVDGGKVACVATVFDTGAPATEFPPTFGGMPAGIESGTALDKGIDITVSDAIAAAPFSTFSTGADPGVNLVKAQEPTGTSEVTGGLSFFQQFTLTYNVESGQILFGS